MGHGVQGVMKLVILCVSQFRSVSFLRAISMLSIVSHRSWPARKSGSTASSPATWARSSSDATMCYIFAECLRKMRRSGQSISKSPFQAASVLEA
eukprot:4309216-Pleurochrysis_carterae.AAC.6